MPWLSFRGMPRKLSQSESVPMLLPLAGGSGTMIKLGELVMILELHRQGLKVSAIARQLGLDRKTVRRYIERGLEPPSYGPRPPQPRSTDPFLSYLHERLAAYPGLTAVRLWRELRERDYAGGYTAVKRTVREIRPEPIKRFEVRFETPPGEQAQVDLARFEVAFTDEPGITRIVWLFSLVLGHSRLIWARFVVHQDLQSVLRCHIAALEAIGGAPREILYDRMKTAVIGEDAEGLVIYNRSLLDLARHYGFQPRACRPYHSSKTSAMRSCACPTCTLNCPRQVFHLSLARGAITIRHKDNFYLKTLCSLGSELIVVLQRFLWILSSLIHTATLEITQLQTKIPRVNG
jgi:transposase